MIKFQMIFEQLNKNSTSFCLMIRRSNRKKKKIFQTFILLFDKTSLPLHSFQKEKKKQNTSGLQLSFIKDSGTQIAICKEWCEVANMAIAWVTQKFKTPCLRGFSVMDSHVEWQINNGEKIREEDIEDLSDLVCFIIVYLFVNSIKGVEPYKMR